MTARTRRLLAPTLPELWAFLAVALPVVAALAAPMSAVDLAYGVRAGQLMLESGSVLRTDPFTFTMGGQPWLDQQWLAQIFFALLHGAGGWALIALTRAALVGVLYGLIFFSCRYVGVGLRTAAGLTLAAFVIGAPSLAMRPQLLGEVLFALTLVLVMIRRRHARALWLVPLLVAAWANLHGTFFLGIGLLVVAVASDALAARRIWRSEALVLALAVLATGLTPWGFGVWPYALALGTSPVVRSLAAEWQVTSPLAFPGIAFYASVVGLAVLASIVARRVRWSSGGAWPWIALLVALAVLGAYAERGVAWWAIAAPSSAASLFARLRKANTTEVEGRSTANLAIASAIALVGAVLMPWWRPAVGSDGLALLSDAPAVAAAEVSEVAPPGSRLFVPQSWGSWFELAAPGFLVPVDSRFELYSPRTLEAYLEAAAGSDRSSGVLRDWDVSVAVVPDDMAALSQRLSEDPSWMAVKRGGGTTLFQRR